MYIPELSAQTPRRGNAFSRWVGRSYLRLTGWSFKGEIPDAKKCLMIVTPHTSNWDFVIGMFAMLAMGLKVSWMGKDSIFIWPVRGFLLWLGGIPTVRSRHTGAVEQRINIFKQSEQLIVAIAPEGTRHPTERWKTGFYHIAVGAEVPILPLYWDYKAKEVGLLPLFHPTGDMDQDLKALQALFKDISPRYPENSKWQRGDNN